MPRIRDTEALDSWNSASLFGNLHGADGGFLSELEHVSGRFLDENLPDNKNYLLHYFRTEHQQTFLRYYLKFGNYDKFTEHTGFELQNRWLKALLKKLEKLEAARVLARKNLDFTMIADIESGKYKV